MNEDKGFYLDINGEYKTMDGNEELKTVELNHSIYGLIKYVIYCDIKHPVSYTPTEEMPTLPCDWVEEI